MFLNEYRGQLKEEQQINLAMAMVRIELKSNMEALNEWLPYHEKVLNNLNESLNNNAINSALFTENGEMIWSLMPNGVVQRTLDNGSWQTLKSSSLSSAIDFDTMFTLSKLYKHQAQGVESTLNRILTILSARESLEKKNQRSTVILLRNTFNEMVSQEMFLIEKYKQALNEMGIERAKI
ncbi:hypothetical protein ACRWQL_03055 [Shewanella sp. HL-SH4]|uniref:hypothetical protein n=1 Tax=Shewanella sp. HL-SH4 TaxID=3436240 RepID=UPI003EC0B617